MKVKVSIQIPGRTVLGQETVLASREVFLDLPRLPDMFVPQHVATHDALHGIVHEAMERALAVVREECMLGFGVPLVGAREFLG